MRESEKNKRWIRLLAGLFLFILISEFGSHGAICAAPEEGEARTTAVAQQNEREDPCQTLVLCSNTREKDRQAATLAHDKMQHNGFVSFFSFQLGEDAHVRSSAFAFSDAQPRFRPPDPLLRPPINS
jgi:hypothetical protein